MTTKPYRILRDYGSYEGMVFEGEFETAEDALKEAMKACYYERFYIVKIIEFKEKNDERQISNTD